MNQEHPNMLMLELAVVKEAPKSVEDHIASCPRCQAVVEQLRGEGEAFLDDEPFERFVLRPKIQAAWAKPHGGPSMDNRGKASLQVLLRTIPWLTGLVATAALGIGLVFLGTPGKPELRSKGSGQEFAAIRLRGGDQSRHHGRVSVRAGDRLRFAIQLADPSWVRLEIEASSGSVLVAEQYLESGLHHLPNDSIEAESPVEDATVVLATEHDGHRRELLLEIEADD